MERRAIAHWRMRNLRLSGAPWSAPEDVVGWLGAVQSQDFGPAKWSVGQRATGATDAALDRSFADGAILRTHVLRPTWHFVLPADIRWMLELTALRVHAFNAFYYRQQELDDETRRRCTALLADALQGGNWLTRTQIAAVLERAGIAASGLRLGLVLMSAELDGVICSGPRSGKQHTYALLDERAPPVASRTRDEALAELTLRYYTSHGPATVKDFRWWSSLTVADIKRGIEMVAPRLERHTFEGATFWSAPGTPTAEVVSPTIHLLQGYDEYIVGYSESKYLLAASGPARSQVQDRPLLIGAVFLDSQLAGHWKRTLTRCLVTIEAALYTPFDDDQTQALRVAADSHGEFLGLDATVVTTAF